MKGLKDFNKKIRFRFKLKYNDRAVREKPYFYANTIKVQTYYLRFFLLHEIYCKL